MGGNIPIRNFLGGNFPGRFSRGSLMGGNFPGGNFPGGIFLEPENRVSFTSLNILPKQTTEVAKIWKVTISASLIISYRVIVGFWRENRLSR